MLSCNALIRIWLGFTSIPGDKIMPAVDWMLQQFMLKYNLDPLTYSFSVSLQEEDSKPFGKGIQSS